MNESPNPFLKKTLFWQRVAFVVFGLFLVVMLGIWIFYVVDGLSRNYNYQDVEFFLYGILLLYILGGVAINVILYFSIGALKRYLATQQLPQLEKAIRWQRIFWTALLAYILGVIVVGVGAIFSISFIVQQSAVSEPPM